MSRNPIFYVHYHEYIAVWYLVENVSWARSRVALWNSYGIEVNKIWSQLLLLSMLSLFYQYNRTAKLATWYIFNNPQLFQLLQVPFTHLLFSDGNGIARCQISLSGWSSYTLKGNSATNPNSFYQHAIPCLNSNKSWQSWGHSDSGAMPKSTLQNQT